MRAMYEGRGRGKEGKRGREAERREQRRLGLLSGAGSLTLIRDL
jgi:hypothetical protein